MTFCCILMMITAEKNVIPDQDTETKLLTNYSAAVKVKTRASTVTLSQRNSAYICFVDYMVVLAISQSFLSI